VGTTVVTEARGGSPAVSKQAVDRTHLRLRSGEIPVRLGSGVGDSGSGSFLGSRRSSSSARRGRGGGVAGPRRSRARRSRAARGVAARVGGSRGGPRAAFIGRRSALGVRARAGKLGVGFAGDRGTFCCAGERRGRRRTTLTGGPGGSAGATRARTGKLACGTRPSAPRRGESECGRVGPAFACEQAVWRGPSRGGKELGPGGRGWLGRGAGRSGGSGPRERSEVRAEL